MHDIHIIFRSCLSVTCHVMFQIQPNTTHIMHHADMIMQEMPSVKVGGGCEADMLDAPLPGASALLHVHPRSHHVWSLKARVCDRSTRACMHV